MDFDPDTQAQMVERLKRPAAFAHAADDLQHLQTHISHVLLAGEYAYKIKKPLDLGFLDFSTGARRRFCCDEELRLNSRLAGSVYLDVVAITGTLEQPVFGGDGAVLEHAVRMRRFSQDGLLSRREVSADLIDRIADRCAAFHAQIPAAAATEDFGTPEAVFFPMQQNFDQIRPLVGEPDELARLDPLERWTQERYVALRDLLARRKAGGHVKECHGDMHLGNIALVDGEVVIFDGIEFNPDLRWIDTMNEVAFLVMDLEQAGRHALARRFLNRYLQLSGDYAALPLLNFYKVYRALVRAKVTAIRLGQSGLPQDERAAVLAEYGRYVTLAETYTRPAVPALIITYGVSGSGKTHLGGRLLETMGGVRIRSDVERKRLFGLPPEADSKSEQDAGIYTPEATERTYAHMAELAKGIIEAGYGVLVDATFLKRTQRQAFVQLAADCGCPFVVLEMEASDAELRERILRRQAEGGDASEADIEVLERQLAGREPLDTKEVERAVRCHSGADLPLDAINALADGAA